MLSAWLRELSTTSHCHQDWFDGYLARRWKQRSSLGALLDPLAATWQPCFGDLRFLIRRNKQQQLLFIFLGSRLGVLVEFQS